MGPRLLFHCWHLSISRASVPSGVLALGSSRIVRRLKLWATRAHQLDACFVRDGCTSPRIVSHDSASKGATTLACPAQLHKCLLSTSVELGVQTKGLARRVLSDHHENSLALDFVSAMVASSCMLHG